MAMKDKGGFGGVPAGSGFAPQQLGGYGRTAFGPYRAQRTAVGKADLPADYRQRTAPGKADLPSVQRPAPGKVDLPSVQRPTTLRPRPVSTPPTTLRPRPGAAIAAPVVSPAAVAPIPKAKPSRPVKQDAAPGKKATSKTASGGTGIRTGTKTGSTAKQAGGGGKMKESASQRQSRISREKNTYRSGGSVKIHRMAHSGKKR